MTRRTVAEIAPKHLPRAGFTLTELLVVLVIIALLSALTLSGLAGSRGRGKVEATKLLVGKINDAILEAYEEFEDQAASIGSLTAIRSRMRSEFPEAWAEVAGGPGSVLATPTTAIERAYGNYKLNGGLPSENYQGAECLYMIVTQSGRFNDLVSQIRPEQVGDRDGDGYKEFLDAWGNPIAFLRWAPGYVSPAVVKPTIQVAEPETRHDPFDRWYVPPPAPPPPGCDPTAYALFPLIYSAGPDEAGNSSSGGPSGYGLITSLNGWANGALSSICTFNPGAGLVGAPDPSSPTAYLDNVTNFDLMLE
jgi:prepilin-type N-terminal cleavage/methylation domain-containing protein